MNHRLILAGFLVLSPLAPACSKKDAPPAEENKGYGDPVGIKLSGSGPNDPTYEIAFAVTKGQTPPSPDSMAGPVYVAAKSCSQVQDVTKNGQTLRVKVILENGVVKVPSMPDEPAAACLLKALDGKAIAKVPAAKADVLIELRAPEKAS